MDKVWSISGGDFSAYWDYYTESYQLTILRYYFDGDPKLCLNGYHYLPTNWYVSYDLG